MIKEKKITLNAEKRKVIADQFQSFYEDKVKDKLEESLDQKILDDIHYQNLQSFNINTLVKEEIYLNFPSIFFCCTKKIEKGDNIIHEKKIKPFKKIKDLIK